MYADDSIDIARVIESAKDYVITNDRKIYLPILRLIEEFIASQGRAIIIGGQAGIYALCGNTTRDINQELWKIELFSQDIVIIMRQLLEFVTSRARDWNDKNKTNPEDIYPGDYRTIILRTSIPDREYVLYADHRVVAIGKTLGERSGISIIDIVEPTISRGPFGTPGIALMPRELQIMHICHSLCAPNLAGNWVDTFIPLICSLFDLGPLQSRDGGGDGGGSADKTPDDNSHMTFDLSDAILTGEHAVSYYTGARIPKNARVQYICSFDGIDEYIARKHMTTSYVDIRAPDDFRLRKMILRDVNGVDVADLFNQISYEPVPVNRGALPHTLAKARASPRARKNSDYLIAAPFNVLRILLADTWALSFVITSANVQTRTALRARRQALYNLAQQLWHWIVEKCPVSVLFPTEYIGTYEAESLAKRKIVANKAGARQMSAVAKKDLIDLRAKLFAQMKLI